MNNRYFSAINDGSRMEITIYGDITSWEWLESDVSSYTLSKLVQESKATEIEVHINSYGGETAEGLAIYNALKNHPAKIITRCDGFACSAASVVFMAGEERLMNEASLLMIHNAWTHASGNADELRKQADDLETISQVAANTYLSSVNISKEELEALLKAESWITPEDAVKWGFATGIIAETVKNPQYSARKMVFKQLITRKDDDGTAKKVLPLFHHFH